MPALSCRHSEIRESAVQIIIERFHRFKNLYHFRQECPDIRQILILDRVFEIPALIFQVFGLRMILVIPGRHLFESRPLYRKIFGKGVCMNDLFPFVRMLHDIVPHHDGGLLEHIGKQSAAQKGFIAGLYHQIISNRDRELSHRADVGAEGGIVG